MIVHRVLREHEQVAAGYVVEHGLLGTHSKGGGHGASDKRVFVFAGLLRDFLDGCALFGSGHGLRFLLTPRFFLPFCSVQRVHPVFNVAVRVAVQAAKGILHVLFEFVEEGEVLR